MAQFVVVFLRDVLSSFEVKLNAYHNLIIYDGVIPTRDFS